MPVRQERCGQDGGKEDEEEDNNKMMKMVKVGKKSPELDRGQR